MNKAIGILAILLFVVVVIQYETVKKLEKIDLAPVVRVDTVIIENTKKVSFETLLTSKLKRQNRRLKKEIKEQDIYTQSLQRNYEKCVEMMSGQ